MQILVTEVTGDLGRTLAQSLLAAGHAVYGIAERPHRDLDPAVNFVCAAPTHPVLYRLAEHAEVVVLLTVDGHSTARQADVARICDAAARGGARIVFPSLSLLAPDTWQQAEDLVSTGWAPNLVVRIATPLGRQADVLVCRSVAALLDSDDPGPLSVVHLDDVIRFLVLAAGSDRTGVVNLATADSITAPSAQRLLGGVDPRPRLRSVPGWRQLPNSLDPSALGTEWDFECGWGATDTVADTVRGLRGRRMGPDGAVAVSGRIPMPVTCVPRVGGGDMPSAAADGAGGEFDDWIDPRFPTFVASPLCETAAGPLTPMSLDLHLSGLRTAGRALAQLLDLRDPVASEWERRLVAVFGHRIYLGASALAAAEARLPAKAAAFSRRLRSAPDTPDAGVGLLNSIAGVISTAHVTYSARMFGRHVRAYRDAADAERRDAARLVVLRDAQLDARIRLLRSRIHEGWVLTALSLIFAEVAPDQLSGAGEMVSISSQIASLARVLRAFPYARKALEDGDMAAARAGAPMLATAFDTTLAHVGHRGPGAAELAASTLSDRPDAVLAAAARVPNSSWTDDRESSSTQVCRALSYDNTMRFTHQMRLAVRELGRRLAMAGTLARADDVFYLTLDEALGLPADSRLRVKRRFAERERLHTVRLPAVIDAGWRPAIAVDVAQIDDVLRGTGLFPGVAQGVIRVVDSTACAGLHDDDVAVITTADIESVPLLGTPAAVLTGGGSTVSDPARVAAELAVPFVAGIADVAARLCPGMRVRVDGSTGLITVLAQGCEVVGA